MIRHLEGTQLISPVITEKWEVELENIYKKKQGYEHYKVFLNGIKNFVWENLALIKGLRFEPIERRRVR